MPDLPFGLSSYSRADGRLAPVRLWNMYAEESPTSPTGIVLLPRPGLEALFQLPIVRGMFREDGVIDGDLMVASDQSLYRNDELVGSLPGLDRTEWAYTVDGLFVLSDGIVYVTDGVTIEATDFPDGALVASISQINNILVAVRQDTGTVYFRLPGDTEWGALDFFSAEREPDPAIAVRGLADVLWVFGSASIEPFVPTDEADVPFQRLSGASIARGCKDRDSIVQLDNTLFFTGEDNIAYRLDAVPARFSNHGIEERISRSTTAKAWTFVWDGHAFYVLKLDDETLVHDVSSNRWTQFVWGGELQVFYGFYDGQTTYVGGSTVWTFKDRADDDFREMTRLFTSIAATKAPQFCAAIQVILSPGVGPLNADPAEVQTRFSDDQGRTWSDWIIANTGLGGQYRHRVIYRRQGMIDAPGRIYEHKITDPVNVRISGVEMNPELGGRARA